MTSIPPMAFSRAIGCGDLRIRPVSLHADGGDENVYGGAAAARNGENVRITAPEGDVTTAMRAGKNGMGRLRSGAKSPSAGQAASAARTLLEGADAHGFDCIDDELIFAARLVNAEPGPADYAHALLRLEPAAGWWRRACGR